MKNLTLAVIISTIIALAVGGYAGYRIANQNWIDKQESTNALEKEVRDNTLCEMTLTKMSAGEHAGQTIAVVGGNDKDDCLDVYLNTDAFPDNTETTWLW